MFDLDLKWFTWVVVHDLHEVVEVTNRFTFESDELIAALKSRMSRRRIFDHSADNVSDLRLTNALIAFAQGA